MSRIKELAMQVEELVWEEVTNIIPECESLKEAQDSGRKVAYHYGLNRYLDDEYFDDVISNLWDDFWSEYNGPLWSQPME